MTGTSGEILTWFQTWGNVVFVVAQILFWAAVGFAAVYGALAYKRLVDHKTRARAASPEAPMTVKIDEFVE
ncbi:MAG: hypothetical protein D9V44_05995 [Actinobacteria bacterium]|nr:MAG: hypothetical protein D9V44_05995 [Actinomycetota bacterium]